MKMFQHIQKKMGGKIGDDKPPDKLLKLKYENETLKNDSILSDYERIQFIENGIGLSVTFITHIIKN